MKNAYKSLYFASAIIFLIVILGGSVTKPVFNGFSEKSLNTIGIKKSSVDSVDNSIDEMLYKVNRINLKIEKLKNLFSDEKIDEEKYSKVKNEIIFRNVYTPVIEVLNTTYRIVFFIISVVVLFSAVILQLIYRGTDLKRRVAFLEEKVNQLVVKN